MMNSKLFIGRKWLLSCLLGSFALYAVLLLVSLSLEKYLVFEKSINQADAIVVMAGSPAERLPTAVFLYGQGTAPTIILANDGVRSAWSELFQRNLYEIEWAEQTLIKAGIPEQAIVKLPFTESGTYFDVQHTVKYVLDNKIDSLVIVTADYHTKRTYWTFNLMAGGRDIELGIYPAYLTELSGENVLSRYKRAKLLFVEFIKLIYYEIK